MKGLKYFTILFVALLLITGCGKKDKEKEKDKDLDASGQFVKMTDSDIAELEEAIANMQNVKSGSVKMEISMLDASGESVSVVANADYDEFGTYHMNMTMSMMGMTIPMELYMQEKGDEIYTYSQTTFMGMGTGWMLAVGPKENPTADAGMFGTSLEDYLEVKKYKTSDPGTTKFSMTISKEKMAEMLADMNGEDNEMFEIASGFTMDIYTKDGYIVKIDMDLSELLTETGATYKMVITFSNFNNVGKITIPSSVIDNATNLTDDAWGF